MLVDISFKFLFKVLAVILLTLIVVKVWPILMLLFFSVIVAVAFESALKMMGKYIKRRTGVLIITLLLSLFVGLIIFVIVPPLAEQVNHVIDKLPNFFKTLTEDDKPQSLLHALGKKILGHQQVPDLSTSFGRLMEFGQLAVGGISSFGLFFAFTIYLMLDGPTVYRWFLAFIPKDQHHRVEQTAQQMSTMISAYVLGQGIACLACGVYVFAILSFLKVPAALMLGVMAALFAVLPIIGFYVSLIPILLFSLLVSPSVALATLSLMALYHLFEGYFLLPLIYSKKLRLSGFVVLVCIIFGMSLMGVLGAIALLPLAASYPVIEKIWLSKYLNKDVVSSHERLNSGE